MVEIMGMFSIFWVRY